MSSVDDKFKELDKSIIDRILREKIEKCLGNEKLFKADKIKRWSETICRDCLRDLGKLQKPFKFIVTCSINQRTGGAFVQHTSSFADPVRDTITTIHWLNDALHCIINVYAFTLY